jgi:hypothetical protein
MRTSILLACCFIGACGSPEPPAITVGAVSFTEDQLLGLSPERRETLAYLAAFGSAVADSTTAELGAPLVRSWEEDRLLEILGAQLTLEKNGVEDAVLEARYLTDPEWELTVRHILFFSERWRSPSHRAEAEAKAGRAMEALASGADFAETAARLSEEPGAEGRQGLLTPGREGSWVPEFWAAALAMEPSEISAVTETQYGYHILRLEDRQVVPFEEARSVVAREVADRIEDPSAVLQAWIDEAVARGMDPLDSERGRLEALGEADRRGLTVPESERAELSRVWEDQAYQWSVALGFGFGLSAEQVGEAALEALARSAQNANIARSALEARADLFHRRYDIQLGGEGS